MPEPMSSELTEVLSAFASEDTILIALDFDGTLAPLVDDPEESRMIAPAREVLEKLTSTWGVTIAIVSGRSIDSLRRVADPLDEWFLVGSHGIEVVAPGELLRYQTPWLVPTALITVLKEIVRSHPGTRLEIKPFGLALHTRGAAWSVAHSASSSAQLVFEKWKSDLVVRKGKAVVECSIQSVTKGDGLLDIVGRCSPSAVLFAGDDQTDEDGFAALGSGDVSIHVGSGVSLANYRVETLRQVPDVLSMIYALRMFHRADV